MSIAFIGAGNMAASLIGGLKAHGYPVETIRVADPVASQTDKLRRSYGVTVAADNHVAVRDARSVVLAVKPQDLPAMARGIAPEFAQRRRLVISIAAGIRTVDLRRWLGDGAAIVRTMPNRPAQVGCGITALYAAGNVSEHERREAAQILSACGETVWLDDEAQMDAVTAVSGSGPAYFFLLMEMLESTGIELGLAPQVARRLAIATAHGAGRMAFDGSDPPAALREQVTSKGGTTAAALAVLEAGDVRGIFRDAICAAARRSAVLAEEMGKD
jgi:pyrroline-5-carboxylate reductase